MSYQNEQDFTNEKIDFSIWKRLLTYAVRNRRLLAATIAAMLLVAVIDAMYPLLTNYAIDTFVIPLQSEGLRGFFLIYLGIIALQGTLTYVFISRSGRMEMAISYAIRQDAFMKLQTLSFSFYDKTAVGYLMARMISDIGRIADMIAWSIVDALWSLTYALSCITVMMIRNWRLALIVLCVIPPLCVISILLQKKILKYQRETRRHNSRITGAFNEGIMGAMTTKTLVLEDKNAEEFEEITSSIRRASVRSLVLSAVFFPLVISLGAIGTCLALCLGARGVLSPSTALVGSVTAGTLVAFITYASNLFDPIQQLAHIFAELQGAQASAERVISLIDTPLEITDSAEVTEKYGDLMHPKRENWEPLHGDIRFEDVSFSYKSGETILSHFNLEVKQGQTIALVGETGAGKSTIVNLICRFYEPTEGRILIDGRDYRDRSQLWLQSNLGYVLQQPHLFSGTIRDNISFARPDAPIEDVKRAATTVCADAFIEQLEKGYNTEVGEGGARLSTGQKQLISFARVILADPRLFVLDEATSSIDTEMEQLIQNAITNVLDGRTSFVVAHRLSTIRNADRILVIRNGSITESGTHEELLAQQGYYYKLYMRQFREESTQASL